MSAAVLTARVLFWGGVVSIALMTVGVLGFALHGGLAPDAAVFTSVSQVVRAVSQWPVDPLGVAGLGILLLMITPALGVVTAFVAFLAAGDFRYAGISGLLLIGLLISLVFAAGG
jgi:uncharacterized membrane protein